MKKIIILAIALASLSLTACQDFLDVRPEGTPSTDTYFTNDAQSENAIKSLYSPMIDGDDLFGRDAIWEQCLGTQMVPGRTRDWPDLFCLKWNGDESPLRSVFEKCYAFGARANWIIAALLEKQEKTELTYVEKRSLGEAYFMRAFFMYYIAYRYGTKDQGIPQVKYEKFDGPYDFSIPPQAASVCDNYKMIIEDLEESLNYLSSISDYSASERGRACKESAIAMEARVYSQWATWDKTQWNNVITAVNTLENEYGRALLPKFSDNFNDEIATWWNSEYCWSVPSNGGHGDRVGAEFPGLVLENKGWGVYNGWGQCKPTYDAYEEFSKDGDRTVNERLARTILEYGVEFEYSGQKMKYYGEQDVETGFQINKWMEPFKHADFIETGYVNESGGSWPSARINYHVIRFADCMLLRAEANINLGNAAAAAKDLNAIRKRAGLKETCTGTYTELYHERYCELAYEPMADHGGDLRRWAISDNAEIKALAIKELESHPRALFHIWRGFYGSPVGQGSTPRKTMYYTCPECGKQFCKDTLDAEHGFAEYASSKIIVCDNRLPKLDKDGNVMKDKDGNKIMVDCGKSGSYSDFNEKEGDATKYLGMRMIPTVMGDGKEAKYRGLDYTVITTKLADGQPDGVGPYKDYEGNEGKWDNHLCVYPYPSQQVSKSAGALKQNAGY